MSAPAAPAPPAVHLIALRVLPTAIRCRELDAGLVTYRRSLPRVIPGEHLVVATERRWTFRRTDMIGGPLEHASFSLRALWRSGIDLPEAHADGLTCPGLADPRLDAGREALLAGDWLGARAGLLDVLADQPGCLVAHSLLGDVHAALRQTDVALAHHSAAARLGAGAVARSPCLPLSPGRLVERCLLQSLVGRAALRAQAGDATGAIQDLEQSLLWDPTDACHAAELIAEIPRDSAGGGGKSYRPGSESGG